MTSMISITQNNTFSPGDLRVAMIVQPHSSFMIFDGKLDRARTSYHLDFCYVWEANDSKFLQQLDTFFSQMANKKK